MPIRLTAADHSLFLMAIHSRDSHSKLLCTVETHLISRHITQKPCPDLFTYPLCCWWVQVARERSHNTRRCRGVTYPESCITKYTTCTQIVSPIPKPCRCLTCPPPWSDRLPSSTPRSVQVSRGMRHKRRRVLPLERLRVASCPGIWAQRDRSHPDEYS